MKANPHLHTCKENDKGRSVREIKHTHLQLDYMNKHAKKQALIPIATQ
jgi:hypothetical protein